MFKDKCKGLCVPSDDENIVKKLEGTLQKEKQQPPCKCKKILQSFDAGSFKDNISLVQLDNNNRIIVVYKQTKFDNNKIHDIVKEAQIQKKVHDEAGEHLAPDVYRLDYYEKGKDEEIFLMTGYAGDGGYEQLPKIKDKVNFMEVYPCVDNSCDDEIYNFFTKVLPIYKKMLIEEPEEEPELDDDDIELCKYYATLFNSKNYRNCLEQWYMRCKHFFVPFFRDLHELHKIDVFHHDLRSDNIWYKKDADGYHFKFIDFGISTSLEESLTPTFPPKDNLFGGTLERIPGETPSKDPFAHINFDDNTTLQDRKNVIVKEMNDKNFSKQTLKDLMMVEITMPLTIPFSEQDIDKYHEFTFFNVDIFDDIMDVMNKKLERIIKQYGQTNRREQRQNRKEKATEDAKIVMFFLKHKKRIIETFKEFIAEKYAEAILNQHNP